MTQLPPGLVLLASYPKSGNTWMRILLSNLLETGSEPENINALRLPLRGAASRAFFESETLVDSHLLRPAELAVLQPVACDTWAASLQSCAFLKTHDAWEEYPNLPARHGVLARAVVYLVRDPRDVALSLAAYRSCDVDTAINFLNNGTASLAANALQLEQRLLSWSDHARGWLSQTTVPVLLLRYEDMVEHTAGAVMRVVEFLGGSFESEDPATAVARVVRHSSFDELRRQEQMGGFCERPGFLEGRVEPFFRNGKAGSWRQTLTPQQAGLIAAVHAEQMKHLGYEPV
jgi:aryl sulfotransferase